jgi:hypothetical protein
MKYTRDQIRQAVKGLRNDGLIVNEGEGEGEPLTDEQIADNIKRMNWVRKPHPPHEGARRLYHNPKEPTE